MTRPTRPSDLGDRGRRLWRHYTDELEDLGERVELLVEACRTLDLVERMDVELRGSLVVTGSMGQDRPHPLLTQRRAALVDLSRLLEALR